MSTTIFQDGQPTLPAAGVGGGRCPDELLARYGEVLDGGRLNWTQYHKLGRRLGSPQGQIPQRANRGAR